MSEIFAEKVVTSRRTYFFDVKETREGSLYLIIGELTQVGNETERHRVMVFEENVEAFMDGMMKAVEFMVGGEKQRLAKSREVAQRVQDATPPADRGDLQVIVERLERIEQSIGEIRRHFA